MYIYDEELPPCDSTVQYHPQKLDIIDLVNTDKFKEILIYKKRRNPPQTLSLLFIQINLQNREHSRRSKQRNKK